MFYMLPKGIPFKIVTGRHAKHDLVSKALRKFEERLYNAVDVRSCSKIDGNADPRCAYKVYEPFKTSGPMIVVVFPDKFGAQFYGDRRMFYRSGAFAAAIAAGVPIVDTLSMYPTFAHQYHTAKTTRIVHPNHTWPQARLDLDAETYVEYTQTFAKEIEDLRSTMEGLFYQDITFEEAKIGSCDANVKSLSSDAGLQCSRCTYKNTVHGAVCQK
jgi:hypothetical protein